MRNRIITLTGALLLVAATGGDAITQTEETGQVWQGRVELTEAQKEQIAQLQEMHREASAEAAAEIIKIRAEVQSLIVQTDTDLDALQRTMNRLSELENAQRIQRMRHTQAYQDLLTDEQKSQMRSSRTSGMFFNMPGRMSGSQAFQGRMGGSRVFQGRVSGGQAFQGRRANFTRGRGQQGRFMQGRIRGNMRGFSRGGRAVPPVMQGRFGNVDPSEMGIRMRARIHTPGSALPPPSAPPPPPID